MPFYVSPIAMGVMEKCYSREETIPSFRDTLARQDNDQAVIRTNGGRYKLWKKMFVGYERDTDHNKNGGVIPADEIPGYKSAINSELWQFIFKVLGGEKGNSVTGFMKCMPVMDDMTRSYTDAEWYKAFNITATEQDQIAEVLSELS